MRLRTFTASLVVAAAATLPLAGVASAQPDRNCDDFSSQQEAQEALRPGDPDGLDDDNDGQACDNFDYASSPTTPADEDESSSEGSTDEDAADDSGEDDRSEDSGSEEDSGSDDDGQVSVVPQGGVDTGDGSSDPGPAPFLIAGAVAAAVAAGAARRARSSR